MFTDQTVAAIATPRAVGGISVIRISGAAALEVASRVFRPHGGRQVGEMAGYTCCYGELYDGERRLDDGILTVFRAPHSYTGEDTAELSCHGGIFVTEQVLSAVLSAGAAPAAAGEFTKRAFINGKLSLTEAEAVMDIISAEGEQFRRCADEAKNGAVFRRISAISGELSSLAGSLAAWTDYPEEDIDGLGEGELLSSLRRVEAGISSALSSFDSGRILREGISTAIVGKPNVGKSTLMNLLSGFERSIVTDIAGTTRDIVEETVRLGDILLRLSDTAGIRDTADAVEGVGVRLARRRIAESELVLAVFDSSRPLSDEDREIAALIESSRAVAVINKTDLPNLLDEKYINDRFKHIVYISAEKGEGILQLKGVLEEIFRLTSIDPAAGVIANERQRQCLLRARESVSEAIAAAESGATLDAVSVVIDEALGALLELTGERVSERTVAEVFSRFCVGK